MIGPVMETQQTIVLAAGGTGGHIFPAQALAEELTKRGYRPVLVTDKRFEKYARAFENMEVRTIRAASPGGNFFKKLTSAFGISVGVAQARKQLRELAPPVVVGFGGYPSFPTMLAASMMGIPTVIHEQNAVLGRANRFLARRVDKIATSFKETQGVEEKNQEKVVFTGNPVRAAVRAVKELPYPSLSQDGMLHILVMGGSQGASVFSKVMPEALKQLPEALRKRIRLDQQCRLEDLHDVKQALARLSINADLTTFFTDIPSRLVSAHLVISRAGASTVAELMAAGRPSILVPLPTAMDDHQTANANAVEEAGSGWLMPEEAFTAEALSTRLENFLNLPSSLTEVAEKARLTGNANAAAELANLVERMKPSETQETT